MIKKSTTNYVLILIFVMGLGIMTGSGVLAEAAVQPRQQDTVSSGDLFQDTLFYGDRQPFYTPQIKRTRFVKVNFDYLDTTNHDSDSLNTSADGALLLDLNLFGGVFYQAHMKPDATVGGFSTWTGGVEGIPDSQVVFSFKNKILSANIAVPGAFYQVRFASEGIHAIHELDRSKFPACALEEQDGHQHHSPGVNHDINPDVSHETRPDNGLDSGSSIDVMVVYNAAARAGAGGTSAMQSTIALAISETNTGYGNSGVSQRLNLVHTAEVSYIESGDISTDLSRLKSTIDGYIDNVHTLRDFYGADVVSMITEGGGGYCGVAYLMTSVSNSFKTSAFGVVKRTCATGNYSFGHELGHNMSARHDRYVDNTNGSPYNYNHGFVSLPGDWRTIMAYNNDCADNGDGSCERLNYWSNPGINYGGLAMGVSSGDSSAADNHLTLNNTAFTVANFRTHVSAATISVTSPNGGESLNGNDTHTITWSSTGSVGNVKIEYSLDNGTSWTTIVSSTPNDGSYGWTVANSDSSQALVRVSEASGGSPSDTSNATFTITASATDTITVTSPNGGESLTGLSGHAITWSSTGTVGNVKIEYSLDNGTSWSTIIASTANDGSYSWTVADSGSTQCLIRISEASDSDPSDTSDAVFTIISSSGDSITVTSPNGGETLSGGSSHTVTWSSVGSVGNVKIEYSLNSGTTWFSVTPSTPNDGSHTWTVPNSASTTCLMRIGESASGNPMDTSDAVFTISVASTAISVSSPNGGETLTGGTAHNIAWTSIGSVGNVKIEYSSDGLSTWTTITASTPNDGSHAWTVPQLNSSNCYIRISQASIGTPTDTSNHKFTIAASATDTITVSSPNGGETLTAGGIHSIRWISTGSVGNVKLEYSLDNGSSWNTIIASTANDGFFSWVLPGTPSGQGLIRISEASDSDPIDTSDATFTISAAPADSITIGSPNGGETLAAGSTHIITWGTSGSISNVKIQFTEDNGSTWSTVIASTPNDNSHSWTVPSSSSSLCKIKVSDASDDSVSDSSDSTFAIGTIAGSSVTVVSPNGGENLTGSFTHTVTWNSTGSVGNVKIEYSSDGMVSWSTIAASTSNDGNHNWTVPVINSSNCYVRITQVTGGTPSDTSNAKFSITSTLPEKITVTSPNGGESLNGGTTHNLSWTSTGNVGSVKIEYSIDSLSTWTTIVSSTVNDGSYGWAVPMVDSGQCYVRVSQVSGGTPSDTSNHKFSISSSPPEIALNRTTLNFGATPSGRITGTQNILIRNSGGQTLNWSAAAADASWLTLQPSAGSGAGLMAVSVDTAGLTTGNYTATIYISDPNASNQSKKVVVTLNLYKNGVSTKPFGEFATPTDNAVVSGSIPVTGWVLDDVGVESVQIFNGNYYVGDAVFVEGARPDVAKSFPLYPNHYKAGWGYMLLTHFLPGGGNGTYTISARATDKEGQTVTLGTRTIIVDNATAFKPFGAIDTPTAGGNVSGSQFVNWGWALTPPGASIAMDGSTIDVYVDGKKLGHPVYNINRSDIAALFPGYANSSGAGGYFYLDTTVYDYGVHTIQWVVKDNTGQTDGIGSRYFKIDPTNHARTSGSRTYRTPETRSLKRLAMSTATRSKDLPQGVRVRHNFNDTPRVVVPDKKGNLVISARETDHLEIQLNRGRVVAISTLPVGSSLDKERGIFRWQMGVGFSATYTLRFAILGSDGLPVLRKITIKAEPRF